MSFFLCHTSNGHHANQPNYMSSSLTHHSDAISNLADYHLILLLDTTLNNPITKDLYLLLTLLAHVTSHLTSTGRCDVKPIPKNVGEIGDIAKTTYPGNMLNGYITRGD